MKKLVAIDVSNGTTNSIAAHSTWKINESKSNTCSDERVNRSKIILTMPGLIRDGDDATPFESIV